LLHTSRRAMQRISGELEKRYWEAPAAGAAGTTALAASGGFSRSYSRLSRIALKNNVPITSSTTTTIRMLIAKVGFFRVGAFLRRSSVMKLKL
jgi:hypothetical protein